MPLFADFMQSNDFIIKKEKGMFCNIPFNLLLIVNKTDQSPSWLSCGC
jgi:hypothetical protein